MCHLLLLAHLLAQLEREVELRHLRGRGRARARGRARVGVRIRVRVRARARVRAAELRHLPRELLVAPPPLAQPDELAAQLRAPHLELGGELLHEALRDDAHHVQRARRLVRVRVRVRFRVRARVSVMLGFRDRVRVRVRVRMRA